MKKFLEIITILTIVVFAMNFSDSVSFYQNSFVNCGIMVVSITALLWAVRQ